MKNTFRSRFVSQKIVALGLIAACPILSGCLLAAAGAGAEAAYVTTQEDRTAGETLTDQRITSSVKTQLLADSEVSGLNINVDTFKSYVTLRGFVRKPSEESRAIEIARSVSGVRGVQSQLSLQP